MATACLTNPFILASSGPVEPNPEPAPGPEPAPEPAPEPGPEPDPLPAGDRSVATNGNLLPYTFSNSTNRHRNIRKKQWLAANADWSDLEVDWPNFTANNTSLSINYRPLVIRAGVKWGGSFHRLRNAGQDEWIVPPGEVVTTALSGAPQFDGDTEIEFCYRTSLPLGYSDKNADFTVGEVVTGAGGASGTIAQVVTLTSTTGYLVLLGESGTFHSGEALTGSLGGSASVQFQTAGVIVTVGSQAVWREGILVSQNADIDWTMGDPNTPPVYTANLADGVITSVTKVDGGSGWSGSGPTMYAWEVQPDGQLAVKSIGVGNLSGGQVHSGTVSNGSPPEGMAWANPAIVFAGGNGFGASTNIYAPCLVTGIPSEPVNSLLHIGDSNGRGWSSTDTLGDRKHNYGVFERALDNRVGMINMSTSGGAAGNQVQFATTFARQYAAYMGKASHCLISLASNDLVSGTTASQLRHYLETIGAYVRTFGTLVSYTTPKARCVGLTVSDITAANPPVVTCANSLVNGESVRIAGIVGSMGDVLHGNTYAIANRTDATFELVGVDTTGATYTSGGRALNFTNPSAQLYEAGFGPGSHAETITEQVRNGTIVSDWGVVEYHEALHHPDDEWKWPTAFVSTPDFVHFSLAGMVAAAANGAFRSGFDPLLIAP